MRRPAGAFLTLLLVVGLSATARSESVSGVAEDEDRFATALTSGDFDGDGHADLAVGVPTEDIGGGVDAGAVNLVYGSASGLSNNGNQVWYQGTAGVGGTAEESDQFGRAVAAGDFDGDGIDDLAVGVPFEDVESGGAQGQAGAVNVLYGSSEGLTEIDDLVLFEKEIETNDNFGEALAAGDFNGDGRDDLAVGAPGEFLDTAGAGIVNVFHGSAEGLSTTAAYTFDQGVQLDGTPDFADRFGRELAAGNLGAGSQDDLAVGVPLDEFDFDNEGVVHVLYGSGGVLVTETAQFWHQDVEGVAETVESTDLFGFSLAIGNFGNGLPADLAIGVPGESIDLDASTVERAGVVHVLYGTSEVGLTEDDDQLWHQSRSGVRDRIETADRFGAEVTAADFGRGGNTDLAISVPNENLDGDPTNVPDAGIVHVLFGTTTGITASGDERWHQDVGGIKDSAENSDLWGEALASGNFGSGAKADLAVGVPAEGLDGAGEAGAVSVLYGSADGLSTTGDQFWHQTVP